MIQSLTNATANGPGAELTGPGKLLNVYLSGTFDGAAVQVEGFYDGPGAWFPIQGHKWREPGVYNWGGAFDLRSELLQVPDRPTKLRLTVADASASTEINGWIKA